VEHIEELRECEQCMIYRHLTNMFIKIIFYIVMVKPKRNIPCM